MRKLYYSISEVSKLVDEESYVLRYWEKEFPALKPKKNRAGNRAYTENDIKYLFAIKSFLRDDKISLKEAKEKIVTFDLSSINLEKLDILEEAPEINLFNNLGEQISNPSNSNNTNGFSLKDKYELLNLLKKAIVQLKN